MIEGDDRHAVELAGKGFKRGRENGGSNTSVATISTARRRADSQADISPR